jgi:hypothetical protein
MSLCPTCHRSSRSEEHIVDYIYWHWLDEAGYEYTPMKQEEEPVSVPREKQPLPNDILNGTASYDRFCEYLNTCDISLIPGKERRSMRKLLKDLYQDGPAHVEPRYNYRRQMLPR